MFLSKRSRNFIYSILYLLPIIFLLMYCIYMSFSFKAFNFESIFQLGNNQDAVSINIIFESLFRNGNVFDSVIGNDIISFYSEYDGWYLPITNVFNTLFEGFILDEGNTDFFYGLTFYLDYCIWVSVAIIMFEVITILPVICRKFFNKLGGF